MNPVELLCKIGRRLNRYYRHWFCQDNYIFRHDGPFAPVDRDDCNFSCYKSFESLPKQVKLDIIAMSSDKSMETIKLELNENASIWVAFMDGRVVSTVFTRKGRYFRRWFLKLQPDDIVVFAGNTHPDFRGRGIAPALVCYALHSISKQEGSAYIDCRTYNKSSIRVMEKIGFKYMAIQKTIKRKWALYD